MLTIDQLKAIQNAAVLTVDLIGFHAQKDSSLKRHLQLLCALLPDCESLTAEERTLLDKLLVLYQQKENRVLEPPVHVTTQWVIDYLEVGKSTFYKEVHNKLLYPVEKIGNRPYYLKSEVLAILVRHEKGAWTFSKLAKKIQKDVKM